MGCYDSVEWMTALSGSHWGVRDGACAGAPMKSRTDPWRGYIADFKLVKPLRGDPPAAFSQNRHCLQSGLSQVRDRRYLCVLFLRLQGNFGAIHSAEADSGSRFCMWDYVWAGTALSGPTMERLLITRGEVLQRLASSLQSISRAIYFGPAREPGKSLSTPSLIPCGSRANPILYALLPQCFPLQPGHQLLRATPPVWSFHAEKVLFWHSLSTFP